MRVRAIGIAALLAPTVFTACMRSSARAGDADELATAIAEADRAQACAAALLGTTDEDARTAARTLGIEPIRLAPHGGAGRDAVLEVLAERAASAHANAVAAHRLASLGADASAEQRLLARERAERSLADSRALCRAADAVNGERLARRR